MATPRRLYAIVPLGYFDDVLAAGVSDGGALLVGRLLTHRAKRSVPGLVQLGPAGLAESLNRPLARTERELAELERAGRVFVDRGARLIYVVGAIDQDGPKTENAVKGMATQYRQLPTSPITEAVRAAIERALSSGERCSAWLPLWTALVTPESRPEPGPESGRESGRGAGFESGPASDPLRSRSRDPKADDRWPRSAGRR